MARFLRSFLVPSLAHAAVAVLLCGSGEQILEAQQQAAPETPRVELFAGYAYFFPNTTISGLQAGGTLPVTSCLCGEVRGGGGSFTYNFTRWFGLTADVSGTSSGSSATVGGSVGNANFLAFSGGPKLTLRTRHVVPFAEALVGEQRLAPALFSPSQGVGVLAGGGLDLPVRRHLAVRLFRADYVLSNQQFGPSPVPATNIRGLRLESGLVFSFGGHRAVPPAAAPAAAPVASSAAPVAAPVALPVQQAPTLVLAANPASIAAGSSTSIIASGTGVGVLTYSFQANAGAIAGTGSTVELTTAGVGAGMIEVAGTVTDERGQTATARITVTLTAVPVVAAATTSNLGTLSFARDLRRPVRVDNEAKAMLDDIALNLQRNYDAGLALIGNAAPGEPNRGHVAAQRAVDAKEYLVMDRGIDAKRIVLYTGTADSKTVQVEMVPLGATLDTGGLKPVDEESTVAQPRTPLTSRTARK